jgi:predicted amidohydrolase YtcJ
MHRARHRAIIVHSRAAVASAARRRLPARRAPSAAAPAGTPRACGRAALTHPAPRLEQALGLYTHGSAWFSADEHLRGRLATGQLADIAVLSDDYYGVEEDAIPALRSELTLVGGQIVHASAAFGGMQTKVDPPD